MASPPGPGSAHRPLSSSSRGPLSPFPDGARFPSRSASPFLPHQHLPGGDFDGEDDFDDDEEGMDEVDDYGDEEEDAEPVDRAARSSQQRRASSPGIGRAEMNGENGARQIQEGHQQQMYNGGTGQFGHGASSRGDQEPGPIARDTRVEDGYGVIGRREGGPASSYWDLLRAHLSDPLTGILMDDATILSCGHSYGSNGMQHIYRMKACGKCGQPITEDSVRPNLALRLAVQAFRREEESAKTLKRRRDRLEQVCTFFSQLILTNARIRTGTCVTPCS
uniref:Uncharacterized protein n=1 Tax=Avena sativa TaxID=4498 RepID=A0ACD6A6P4_AVESA